MTLSNKITILRILLVVFFMTFLFYDGFIFKLTAFFIFIFASFTDYLDGYLAKKRQEITDFGRFMDPIADKILTISAFLAFVEMEIIPAWMVIVIVFRELVITGLRVAALRKGEVIDACLAGKHKTVSQMLAIAVILIFIVIKAGDFSFWTAHINLLYHNAILVLMYITVLFTIISGASYIIRNKKYIA